MLEGSIRRAGNRFRITCQLIEAATGHISGIFALQDEITLNVVGAIEPSLRHAEWSI